MKKFSRQRGATLLVSLIMLVILTLFAVTAINLSNTNLRIVGNMQMQAEATAAAQLAIENVISTSDFIITLPVPQSVDINNDGTADYTVTFTPAPTCQYYKPVIKTDPVPTKCFGSTGAVYCYWTTWDLSAVVSDPKTGASTNIHQGVRILSGWNTAVTYCGA
jgi:type II secretory pathway pseudopilin PulG